MFVLLPSRISCWFKVLVKVPWGVLRGGPVYLGLFYLRFYVNSGYVMLTCLFWACLLL